jgi:hypothetical protein
MNNDFTSLAKRYLEARFPSISHENATTDLHKCLQLMPDIYVKLELEEDVGDVEYGPVAYIILKGIYDNGINGNVYFDKHGWCGSDNKGYICIGDPRESPDQYVFRSHEVLDIDESQFQLLKSTFNSKVIR